MKIKAFSLVEILIVLVIIAIVTGILIPVMIHAKASAKQATDISNLRQIGQAWAIYSGDLEQKEIPLISTLVQSTNLDHDLLQSSCDPYRMGWAHHHPSNPPSGFLYPFKVSVLDISNYGLKGFISLDSFYSTDSMGWAIVPGCDAVSFGDKVVDIGFAFPPLFLGSYSRLNRDTSVKRYSLPLDQTKISTYAYFKS